MSQNTNQINFTVKIIGILGLGSWILGGAKTIAENYPVNSG